MLNREEARLLPILEAAVQEFAPRHRLMAQISLGELIRPCTDSAFTGQATLDAAYASINSKRLDFAVINRTGHLVAAIEYQGTGHFQNRAVLRDDVKREALRKAGVAFIEVMPKHSPDHIRTQLRAALSPNAPGFAAQAAPHPAT